MKSLFQSVGLVLAAALIAIVIPGCGNDEVSFSTLETARAQAKENAEYNAQVFRSGQAAMTNYAVEVQGDSSQLPACPQGDGWASGKLVNKSNPADKIAIKCSTVSGSVGCLTQADFITKPYAGDDGHCQPTTKVPHPIPKIAK